MRVGCGVELAAVVRLENVPVLSWVRNVYEDYSNLGCVAIVGIGWFGFLGWGGIVFRTPRGW